MFEESIMLELATLRQCHEDLLAWTSRGNNDPATSRVAMSAMRARRLLSIDRVRDAFQDAEVLAMLASSVPNVENEL